VLEELHVLPLDEQVCPHCNAAFDLFPGTEDSAILEVNVKAYVGLAGAFEQKLTLWIN
jgi:hypothetical protein